MTRRAIAPLPSLLIDQIAAGEVVESPTSIVKELVENSLDAGASRIDIDIAENPSHRIALQDNGSGIPKAELPLAVARHASSKVHSLDELLHLQSFGFRGEALASIAAVSRFTLTSCEQGATEAFALTVDHGSEPTIRPAALSQGTQVLIEDLFFNVPARRHFLRRDQTEWWHLQTLVKRLALSAPKVSFRLEKSGKRVLDYPSATFEERVRQVFGPKWAEQAIFINSQQEALSLRGVLAPASMARSDGNQQWWALNDRLIQDKHLSQMVRLALGVQLPSGRFPAYALFLTMPSDAVDVNVHPSKQQVRFRDQRQVERFIFQSIQEAITAPEPEVETVHAPPVSAALPPVEPSPPMMGEPWVPSTPPISTSLPIIPPKTFTLPWARVLGAVGNRYLLLENASGLQLLNTELAIYDIILSGYHWKTQPITGPKGVEILTALGFEFSEGIVSARPMIFPAEQLESLCEELSQEGVDPVAAMARQCCQKPWVGERLACLLDACGSWNEGALGGLLPLRSEQLDAWFA